MRARAASRLLINGIALEKAQDWAAALALWQQAATEVPGEIRFAIRGAGAALRLGEPEPAQTLLAQAVAHPRAGEHAALLAKLAQQCDALRIARHRRLAQEAINAADFATARDHLGRLATLCPDHPWAERRLRWVSGLAPDFADRLHAAHPHVRQHVFLTGCGRSGTWLMAAMLMGITGLRALPGEQPIGAFLWMPDADVIQLIKRQHNAYLYFDRLPPHVRVIHMVRHPWDVLSSTHRTVENYISMARIEGEHRAYFAHLADRPGTLVVRYEDVVLQPAVEQARIEAFLGAPAVTPFADFWRNITLPADVLEAMHGLRPLDAGALHRWRTDPEKIAYLRDLQATSTGMLAAFAARFGYDLTLPKRP